MLKTLFSSRIVPEKAFVLLGLIFGILFLLITPPSQVPDEQSHLYRAFQISELQIIAIREKKQIGGPLPANLVDTAQRVSEGVSGHPQMKQKPEEIFSRLNLPLESKKRIFGYFPNTSLYSPIPYLPQAFGIALGKLIGVSPIILMYMGRIANLLVWIFLVYFSIKIVPGIKWLLFLLALTPMSLFQASSLSADAFTNGISFLFLSTILYHALDKHTNIKVANIYLIYLISVLLSLSKIAYFPLIFTYLLIPKNKLGNTKRYLQIFALLIVLNFGAIAIWSLATKHLYIPLLPGVAPTEQVLFIINHPLKYIQIVINTILRYGWLNIREFIGVLGWLDTLMPKFQYYLYLIILFIVALTNKSQEIIIHNWQKIIIFIIFVVNLVLLMTMLYMSWTSVGANLIKGVQGRYLIAFFPLFFILFYNHKISLNAGKFSVLITGYSLFSLVLTTIVLRYRYW